MTVIYEYELIIPYYNNFFYRRCIENVNVLITKSKFIAVIFNLSGIILDDTLERDVFLWYNNNRKEDVLYEYLCLWGFERKY